MTLSGLIEEHYGVEQGLTFEFTTVTAKLTDIHLYFLNKTYPYEVLSNNSTIVNGKLKRSF